MSRRKRALPPTVDDVRLLTKKDAGDLMGVSFRNACALIAEMGVRMMPVGRSPRIPYWELRRAQEAALNQANDAALRIIEGGRK